MADVHDFFEVRVSVYMVDTEAQRFSCECEGVPLYLRQPGQRARSERTRSGSTEGETILPPRRLPHGPGHGVSLTRQCPRPPPPGFIMEGQRTREPEGRTPAWAHAFFWPGMVASRRGAARFTLDFSGPLALWDEAFPSFAHTGCWFRPTPGTHSGTGFSRGAR